VTIWLIVAYRPPPGRNRSLGHFELNTRGVVSRNWSCEKGQGICLFVAQQIIFIFACNFKIAAMLLVFAKYRSILLKLSHISTPCQTHRVLPPVTPHPHISHPNVPHRQTPSCPHIPPQPPSGPSYMPTCPPPLPSAPGSRGDYLRGVYVPIQAGWVDNLRKLWPQARGRCTDLGKG
jgi:hypothetical protein